MMRMGTTQLGGVSRQAAVALAASCALAASSVASAETYLMRIQAAVPSGSMNFEMLEEFGDRVYAMSDGRLEVRVMGAGAIVPSGEILDAVNDGVLEAGFAWPQFWAGKHPATSLFSNTPIWPMAGLDQLSHFTWMEQGGGREMYHELLQEEIGVDVISFPVTASGWQPLGWFNEPVEGMDDLRAIQYRSPPGLIGEIFDEAGVSTVFISAEELLPAAERGVVGGAGWINPLEDYAIGFQDVFSHYYLASVHQFVDVGEILISQEFYDSLPDDIQEMIRVTAQSVIMETYMNDIARNAEMIKTFEEDYGITIDSTPPEINRALLDAGADVIDRRSADNDFFAEVVQSQEDYARVLKPWWGETLRSFYHLSEDALIE